MPKVEEVDSKEPEPVGHEAPEAAVAASMASAEKVLDVVRSKREKLSFYPRAIYSTEDQPFLVYHSKRNVGGATNRNKEFKSQSGEAIVCRQLAFEFLRHTKRQEFRDLMLSLDYIKQNKQLYDNTFDNENIIGHADEYHETTLDNIGRSLYLCCQDLDVDKPKRIMFLSQNHAMSFFVEKKINEEGTEYYSVAFYDPNNTSAHRRVLLNKLEDLNHLIIHQLLDEHCLKGYFTDINAGVLIVYHDVEHLLPVKEISTSLSNDFLEERLQLLADPTLSEEEKVSRLREELVQSPIASLFFDPSLLRNYMSAILESSLSEANKKQLLFLLITHNDKGEPFREPLRISSKAVYHSESFAVYVELLLKSDLPLDIKRELLLPKDISHLDFNTWQYISKGMRDAYCNEIGKIVTRLITTESHLIDMDMALIASPSIPFTTLTKIPAAGRVIVDGGFYKFVSDTPKEDGSLVIYNLPGGRFEQQADGVPTFTCSDAEGNVRTFTLPEGMPPPPSPPPPPLDLEDVSPPPTPPIEEPIAQSSPPRLFSGSPHGAFFRPAPVRPDNAPRPASAPPTFGQR